MGDDLPLRRRGGVLFLVLSAVLVLLGGGADAGVTSSYRRKLEATVEMPLDADVFRVPPGYNAPQQVGPPPPVPDQILLSSWPLASRTIPFFFLFPIPSSSSTSEMNHRCTSRWATRRARR